VETALQRTTVDYCAYDKPYRKMTDLWTSFDWNPSGNTGNGRCNNGKCGMGSESKEGRFKHRVVIAGENERRLKGKKQKEQLWSLPKKLTEELLCAVQEQQNQSAPAVPAPAVHTQTAAHSGPHTVPRSNPSPHIIIDLFSGGESWRETVETAGFRYVPVNIRPLCTGGKP
jgi:hypothetical protein